MARCHEPWLDYLLRNKAIRNFLHNFAEKDRQEVSKLTLLYGILNLGFLDGKAVVPLDRLRDIVANGVKAVTVESAIPSLREKIEDLRMQLDDNILDIQQAPREVGDCRRGQTMPNVSKARLAAFYILFCSPYLAFASEKATTSI